MGGRKKQTVGHRYFFGIHMGAGRGPMDELVEVKVGDRTAWSGSVTANATVQIDEPELFGGDDKEGGIVGPVDVMMGRADQAVNPRLAAMLGGLVPAFRGVTTLFFDGLLCSGSPYPKPWKMRWRRALKGWDGEPWYPEKAVINLTGPDAAPIKAMNPAHILYECYTNADWGRGLARARLDDAQWRAAADKLYAEGFGMCLAWLRQDAISAFMQGVLDHIAGTHFADPATGLVVLRLIRDGYVADDLPLFDADSGLLSIDDDDAGSQATAVNEVVVRYRSPIDGKDHQVRVKNPGAIHALDGVASTTKDYPGLPTAELALRVAQRDLRAASGFIKKFKVRLDRRGFEVLPGGVFRIRDVARGIGTMVLRAGRVESGPLVDGAITITALQDVFGLPLTTYVDVQAGGWAPPQITPIPVADARLVELPYRDLVANGVDVPEGAMLGVLAAAPLRLALSFGLLTRPGIAGPFRLVGEGSFCLVGVLVDAIGPTATTIELVSADGLSDLALGGAALLGDEVVRVDAVDVVALEVTIARGCSDTVPVAHAAGAKIYFYEDRGAADPAEYSPGATVSAKLLTRTGAGVLPEASATSVALTFAGRLAKPYPPGDLRINGARYPSVVTAVTLALAWRHRDRVLQADQLVDALQTDIGPEVGTTYSWRLLALPGEAVAASGTLVTGTAATVPAQLSGDYRLELWSVRGGSECWQRARHTFAWDQTGNFEVHTVTLGGAFVAGVQIDVVAGSTELAGYLTTVGDASLAGAATSLAAAIDGVAGFSASAAGAVVTVTGPLGLVYSLTGGASRPGLVPSMVQAPAVASPGGAYSAKVSVGNYATGLVEPVPAGVTLSVSIEFPIGTPVVAFSYSTTVAETRTSVNSGLQGAFVAAGGAAGYSVSPAFTVGGAPYLLVTGPVGVAGIYVRTSGTPPFWMPVTIDFPGSVPVPADLPQIVDVEVVPVPVVGEQYVVTLNGVDYPYTVGAGDDQVAVAAALAALVDAAAAFTCSATGDTLRITGATAGVGFTFSARIVPALTVAFA